MTVEENTDYARKTFGSAKGPFFVPFPPALSSPLLLTRSPFRCPGISSDQYHQTGSYDAASAREAQARLSQFAGATAISSNQYYGRNEEEADSAFEANGLGGLEQGARDAVRSLMEQTGIEDG